MPRVTFSFDGRSMTNHAGEISSFPKGCLGDWIRMLLHAEDPTRVGYSNMDHGRRYFSEAEAKEFVHEALLLIFTQGVAAA